MEQTHAIVNLESILELNYRFNESYDEGFIFNSTLLSIMGKLKIFRTCVLFPTKTGEYRIDYQKGRNKPKNIPYFEINEFKRLDPSDCSEAALIDEGYVYCSPVLYRQQLLGVICLGNKLDSDTISDEEIYYVNIICAITANALLNSRNQQSIFKAHKRLEERNHLLKTLFEIGKDFSLLLTHDEILRLLSFNLMGQLIVSRFAVILIAKNGSIENIHNRLSEPPSESVVKELLKANKTIRLRDLTTCCEIEEYLLKVEARVASPMTVRGDTLGLLIIGKRMDKNPFSEENIQFIESLGNMAMAAFENERLFQEEIKKKNLEKELAIALEIQKNLLPKEVPICKGLEIAGITIPSQNVGGDYYDLIKVSDNKLYFAIADVTGKGMPASLIMANVQAALRILTVLNLPIEEIILKINDLIYHNTAPDIFITFFLGILDCDARTIEYVNAGHNPPILLRSDGKVSLLKEGGLILGIMLDGITYQSGKSSLVSGDIIYLYTDGVSEAIDTENNEYGEERLIKKIIDSRELSAESIMDAVIKDVILFTGNVLFKDDLTSLILKFN
ncbi:MAG: PPM-type phosphatase protein [Bacteroidota bacterium]|nr:PPM-type phosphatase protein [Bacteroidota bacterium]